MKSKKMKLKYIQLVTDEQERNDFEALMCFYGCKTASALIRLWIYREKKKLTSLSI